MLLVQHSYLARAHIPRSIGGGDEEARDLQTQGQYKGDIRPRGRGQGQLVPAEAGAGARGNGGGGAGDQERRHEKVICARETHLLLYFDITPSVCQESWL